MSLSTKSWSKPEIRSKKRYFPWWWIVDWASFCLNHNFISALWRWSILLVNGKLLLSVICVLTIAYCSTAIRATNLSQAQKMLPSFRCKKFRPWLRHWFSPWSVRLLWLPATRKLLLTESWSRACTCLSYCFCGISDIRQNGFRLLTSYVRQIRARRTWTTHKTSSDVTEDAVFVHPDTTKLSVSSHSTRPSRAPLSQR